VQIIKRKIRSAIWRLQNAMRQTYMSTVKFAVELLTERYWLLDYLPTFFKKRDGVLLVRLDLIGDFVLWLDSAQAYRRLYPDQKITLAVNSACAELAAALPHWDDVISINIHKLRTNYRYRLSILIRLRWSNFKVAIQPTFSRELVGDLALRASFALQRIGYQGDTSNISVFYKEKTDTWCTRLVKNNPLEIMELGINAHFIKSIGLKKFTCSKPKIQKLITLKKELTICGDYLIIAPGASWQPKAWSVQNFAEVIIYLSKHYNLRIVLTGGAVDTTICNSLAELVSPIDLYNLSGKTSMLELIELIRGAKLLISNDSAPVHIGSAVSTKTICILGGGHFQRFLPYIVEDEIDQNSMITLSHRMPCYHCNWRCSFLSEQKLIVPCIESVAASNVIAACNEFLSHK
jgi:ADP-heptose:LPS heptosyltransferase